MQIGKRCAPSAKERLLRISRHMIEAQAHQIARHHAQHAALGPTPGMAHFLVGRMYCPSVTSTSSLLSPQPSMIDVLVTRTP